MSITISSKRSWALGVALLATWVAGAAAHADTITFTGAITQSTQDGTGPAVNNPDLIKIEDGDRYRVTLVFDSSITAPGTYPLANFSLLFEDLTHPVSENAFDSASVSVIPDGGSYDFSLFACLTTGSGCGVGNSLSAFFQIPAAGLNSQNVAAQPFFGITPLDLLEDDGVTDIHGSVDNYSYVPEPSMALPSIAMLAALAWKGSRKRRTLK